MSSREGFVRARLGGARFGDATERCEGPASARRARRERPTQQGVRERLGLR